MTTPVAFTAHLQSFLESLKVLGYSPQTIKGYGSAVELFFAYLGSVGIANLLQIGSGTLRQYQHWLQDRAYGSWTIATRLQGLRRFFCHLERNQALLVNPCIGLQPAKTPYRLPKTVLTTAEARQVLDTPSTETAVGLRDKAILEVFYSSGIRLEEMARLTMEDVDCKNGYLRVVEGKFAKDRVVPLGQSASDHVRQYVEQVRTKWMQTQTRKALWLGSHSPHLPLKSQAIAVMVRRYGRLSGLTKRVTPHVWRHTCATHLVAGGANIAYVQRLLGHVSLRTTQIYVRTTIPELVVTHSRAHPRNQEPTP